MSTVRVRYIVDDVDAAIRFYTESLASRSTCTPRRASPPSRVAISRSCSTGPVAAVAPASRCRTASVPTPGGWNRIQLEVDDLEATVDALRSAGARFRNEIVTGNGGKQILVEDPAGNPIELFEPFR